MRASCAVYYIRRLFAVSRVDRLLNGEDDITLKSLQRAAAIVGRLVTIELV